MCDSVEIRYMLSEENIDACNTGTAISFYPNIGILIIPRLLLLESYFHATTFVSPNSNDSVEGFGLHILKTRT